MDALTIAANAAMAGISTDYIIQSLMFIDSRDVFSLDNDNFTFLASVATTIAAFITILLFKCNDKTLGKPSFCISIALLILWIVALFMYILRDDRNRRDFRTRDIVRSLTFIVLSAASAYLHFMAGALQE